MEQTDIHLDLENSDLLQNEKNELLAFFKITVDADVSLQPIAVNRAKLQYTSIK